MKTHRKLYKNILTTNGLLRYCRSSLIPADLQSKERFKNIYGEKIYSIFPLDDMLGISKFPFQISINLMLHITYIAISLNSYKKAKEIIKLIFKIDINTETIRCVVICIGRIVYEHDCLQTKKIMSNYKNSGECHEKKEKSLGNPCEDEKSKTNNDILYVETDGNFIPIRNSQRKIIWVENKIGVAFKESDLIIYKDKKGVEQKRKGKCEYISYFGNIKDFKEHLLALCLRYIPTNCKKKVLISDGAGWIRKFAVDTDFFDVHILDLYHMIENIYKFCKYVFSNDMDYAIKFAEEICFHVENGEWEIAVSKLIKFKNIKFPKNTVLNLPNYISNHSECINYKKFKEEGYFVGSGAIESANKYVIQSRLKEPGSSWIIENAQFIATLRAKLCSELWDSEVIEIVYKYFYGINLDLDIT